MSTSLARKKRDRRFTAFSWAIGFVIVGAIGATAWMVLHQKELPSELLCPGKTGPTAHVVLLVDRTDPLTFTQSKAFLQILENFASGKSVREGQLLSVFVLGEDFRQTADPIFEKCNPGDGRDLNPLTATPQLYKQRYDTEFSTPLLSLSSELRSSQASKQSPILQMLQVVALRFEKYDVRGQRSLYIVSDLLHNTPELSLYRNIPDFEEMKKQPWFARARASLNSVDVNVFLLMNSPQLQTRKLSKFWQDYFTEMGATLQRIEPLPG